MAERAAETVVIEATNLTKDRLSSFLRKPTRVLDGLNLQVKQGQTYGLLGPNGAGKTTTIKLLLGLLKADSGELKVLGRAPGDSKSLAKIGFLPENPYFYSHLTGLEFLTFVGQLFAMPADILAARVKSLLARVSLTAASGQAMSKYSKGMLQRLGIAQALINDPELLFLDEPMSGLDPIGRMEVRQILKELKKEGKTIFFNSHLMADVSELCDQIGVMVSGKLVADCPLSSVTTSGNFQELEAFFLEQVHRAQSASHTAEKS